MSKAKKYNYANSPEVIVVAMAQAGDNEAFADLVRRRQSWLRNLMRRSCANPILADDLAQQAFLQAWRTIRQLQKPSQFGPWLKRLAINIWLQHIRKNDILHNAEEYSEVALRQSAATGAKIDLDKALATLLPTVRMCIILSYHEGTPHIEIAEILKIPVGTVKSHIRRGAKQLQNLLSDYQESPQSEVLK